MNIAIIGAGPAGLISARNAIQAGHSVILFADRGDLEPQERWCLS